jgi:hypothetical protein
MGPTSNFLLIGAIASATALAVPSLALGDAVTLPAGFVNTVTTNNNTEQTISRSTSVPNNTLATDTAEGSLFATSSAILQPLQEVTATASVNGLGHATMASRFRRLSRQMLRCRQPIPQLTMRRCFLLDNGGLHEHNDPSAVVQ